MCQLPGAHGKGLGARGCRTDPAHVCLGSVSHQSYHVLCSHGSPAPGCAGQGLSLLILHPEKPALSISFTEGRQGGSERVADLPSGAKARARTQAVCLHSLAQDSLFLSVLPSAVSPGRSLHPSTSTLYTEMVPGGGGGTRGPGEMGTSCSSSLKNLCDQKDCSVSVTQAPRSDREAGAWLCSTLEGVKPPSLLPTLPGTVFRKPFFRRQGSGWGRGRGRKSS